MYGYRHSRTGQWLPAGSTSKPTDVIPAPGEKPRLFPSIKSANNFMGHWARANPSYNRDELVLVAFRLTEEPLI
jgi:hypothetical protein